MPRALSIEEATRAPDATLLIADVLPGSPAGLAGVLPGDSVVEAHLNGETFIGYSPDAFTSFVSKSNGTPVELIVERGTEQVSIMVTPVAGIVLSDPARKALGVSVATVGTLSVSLWEAPIEGAKLTWAVTEQTAIGLYHFFGGLVTFTADLSQVSGPIGIVGAVGSASADGIVALLTLTAVISVNLALINIIPVPALDGGRLLFVLIEAVTRRPLPKGVAGVMNTVGFALLILLMLVVTASDIFKLVT
jgi:regulator of sigma E protease